MKYLFLILAFVVSSSTQAQLRSQKTIDIRISCGFAAVDSDEVKHIRSLVRSNEYTDLILKLQNGSLLEKLLSAIAVLELKEKQQIILSQDEQNAVEIVRMMNTKYILCHTCTYQSEGSIKDLFSGNPSHHTDMTIIKTALFR